MTKFTAWLTRPAFAVFDLYLHRRFRAHVIKFREVVGYRPAIARPRGYHEKMLWRKIFDHNPIFVTLSDKLATKDYVRRRIPGLESPETLWSGISAAQIPFALLTARTVLKANHGSDFNYFPAREPLAPGEVAKLAEGWLAQGYGHDNLEWGYFAVTRRLFIESLIPAEGGYLQDISVECADGVAIYAHIAINQKTDAKRLGNFTIDGKTLSFGDKYAEPGYQLPGGLTLGLHFHEAVAHARILSRGVDYARFDFLCNGKDLYAGEITVYPTSGLFPATPAGKQGRDTLVNPHWDIRKSWFLQTRHKKLWKRLYAWLLRQALNG